MAKADFYPKSQDARVQWHKVFSEQLPNFAVKYGITPADVAKAAADYLWMQWIVNAKNALRAYTQQVTRYFNAIAGNDPTEDPPAALTEFSLAAAPSEPAPGIEFRTRAWAKDIKNSSVYAEADGEAMGIEGEETSPEDPSAMVAEYTLKTLANFELEVGFRKFGMDALKLQFRYKGGEWQNAGFLVTSPGVISIPPQVAGVGEQIEIRAIYIQANNEVGTYSDAKSALIAP